VLTAVGVARFQRFLARADLENIVEAARMLAHRFGRIHIDRRILHIMPTDTDIGDSLMRQAVRRGGARTKRAAVEEGYGG
jgi:putative antitoxin of VapBC-like toxin-antitoxin system